MKPLCKITIEAQNLQTWRKLVLDKPSVEVKAPTYIPLGQFFTMGCAVIIDMV